MSADKSIILSKDFKHKTLEERVGEFQGKLGPYEELAWGETEGEGTLVIDASNNAGRNPFSRKDRS